MDKFYNHIYNSLRIYKIIFLNLLICLIINFKISAQIPLELNDYKTIGSGNYSDPNIWHIWNGSSWIPATNKPNRNNNIFIDQNREIRLIQNEEAKHVYLFSAASPGRKINLQTFELQVYGSLRCFQTISGEFYINNVTNASTDWIYPETGKIVFKGTSRIVVDRSSWSATNSNSRYMVIFHPDDPSQNLTVNSAFKASKFIIQSGSVTQTVNTDGLPACSTFSYNIQATFNGSGPYGDFIIEPAATLISDCSAPLDPIIRRSVSIPGALLHIKPGGNLLLSGNDPLIDVANFQFDGNVYYRSNLGVQRMIKTTMATSGNPKSYHNLFFQNGAVKFLNDSIFLKGDITYLNGGLIQDGPTFMSFRGSNDQQVVNMELNLHQVEVNKPSGTLFTNANLRVKTNFLMKSGRINFSGNDLYINTLGSGNLSMTGGSWLNLSQLHYFHIPALLNPINASFPFEDVFQGGIRQLQLLGNSPRGNLLLGFTEIPGANWDPMFNDSDGTPILYQLNSHFGFSGLIPSADLIELRISAEKLIVDDVDDLRIVSVGQAAPGLHLPGMDPVKLWARRSLTFGELNNNNFTVGSYRVLSILPVTWLKENARSEDNKIKITWSTAKEFQNDRFIIHRSLEKIDRFIPIGEVPSKGDSDQIQSYEFNYQENYGHQQVYFQLEQVDKDQKNNFSKVFRLEKREENIDPKIRLWPNPYTSGELHIHLPDIFDLKNTRIHITDIRGNIIFNDDYYPEFLREKVSAFKPGLYIFFFTDQNSQEAFRFIKK